MQPGAAREVWRGRYLRAVIESWPEAGGDYEVIHKHDAVAVVAVTPADEVVLVRQFRPAVRSTMLEIPAGLLDVEGEDALTCAGRELAEETGFGHTGMVFLGGFYLSPGFTDEYIHIFWARTDPAPEGTPETGIEVVHMPFAQAVAAARGGRFRNATTALGLLLAASAPALRDAAAPSS
jgi:8-oxo-dGTP pyrophosphatase MutT (NUDIX family)